MASGLATCCRYHAGRTILLQTTTDRRFLLGADVLPYHLCGDKPEGNHNEPIALSSIYGWVLVGRISQEENSIINTLYISMETIDQSLQKFQQRKRRLQLM